MSKNNCDARVIPRLTNLMRGGECRRLIGAKNGTWVICRVITRRVYLLIETNDTALRSGGKKKHLNVSAFVELQKLELAAEIAKTAACDYLKSRHEFRRFPVQRFVDFNLTDTPTYISICPRPAKV